MRQLELDDVSDAHLNLHHQGLVGGSALLQCVDQHPTVPSSAATSPR